MTSTITEDAAMTTFSGEQVQGIVNRAVLAALKAKAEKPVHVHHCTDVSEHEWACTSPYCEDVNAVPRACMAHGGVLPIEKGMEPWRGTR